MKSDVLASIVLKIRHEGNLPVTTSVSGGNSLAPKREQSYNEDRKEGWRCAMGANAYEILALAMRYVFAGLMVLIVLRAWRISIVDSRRSARLRRRSPDTGIIGEMLVVNGSERARPGMHYPVTLEGSIGSGRRADIRLRHSTVRSRHALYQMTDDGLFVRGHANARIRDGFGRPVKSLLLKDGDILRVGQVGLMLVLTDADAAPEEINRRILRRRAAEQAARRPDPDYAPGYGQDYDEEIFRPRPSADDLFMSNPAGAFEPRDPGDSFDSFDDYDDYDDYDSIQR